MQVLSFLIIFLRNLHIIKSLELVDLLLLVFFMLLVLFNDLEHLAVFSLAELFLFLG